MIGNFVLALVSLRSLLPADDAAMNVGASGPEPLGWRAGEESIVQMKSEHLSIHFGIETTSVTARFTFLSHKKGGSAKHKLGFPDYARTEREGSVSGPIENLVTKVDGVVVLSEFIEGYYRETENPDGSIFYETVSSVGSKRPKELHRHAWHVIDMEFPEGKEVVVERRYDCPSGDTASNEAFFIYETRTGDAWKGNIVRLTAEVTFQDSVRTDLVAFVPTEGWTWSEDRSEATLVWNEFEPRTDAARKYFQIATLDLKRIDEHHRESPGDFPSVEDRIAEWLREEAER